MGQRDPTVITQATEGSCSGRAGACPARDRTSFRPRLMGALTRSWRHVYPLQLGVWQRQAACVHEAQQVTGNHGRCAALRRSPPRQSAARRQPTTHGLVPMERKGDDHGCDHRRRTGHFAPHRPRVGRRELQSRPNGRRGPVGPGPSRRGAPLDSRVPEPLPRPPADASPHRPEGWQESLGDSRRGADWVGFFDRELAEAPWRAVLQAWVPRLAPGLMAAATHGLIRTGHAVRSLAANATPQRLHELAEGLGYWAATYQRLPGRPSGRHTGSSPRVAVETDALITIQVSPGAGCQMDTVDRRGEA